MHDGPCQRFEGGFCGRMDGFRLFYAIGGCEAAEDLEPGANKKTKCDTHLEVEPVFLRFVDPEDFESFRKEGEIFVFKKRKKKKIPRDV